MLDASVLSDPPDEPREHDACGVGFLADLSHHASHDVVRLALGAVAKMAHRGARAADGRTGDGAGILTETPRALLIRELASSGLRVPERHLAAIGLFMPRDLEDAAGLRATIEQAVRRADVAPLRWRTPGVVEAILGEHARATTPSYQQLLVDMGPGNVRERMRTVRRNIERALRDALSNATLVSASPTTVVYKGLLSSNELAAYFDDLRNPLYASRYAVFHQRFSTNTSPAWRLVQPFGYVAHNGEINTITGNRAWMKARGITPQRGGSDSMDFDTALDAMIGAGYRIDAAVDLMLSPAVEQSDERLRAYYDAHIATVESWDGPAAMIFADGDVVGAALDRSGFRPLRWCRTASQKVLLASEAGVADFGDDPIVHRGRLGPGERLVVRFASGELLDPPAFRNERRELADFRPVTRSWLFEMPALEENPVADQAALEAELLRFGYTKDELKDVVSGLASGAGEPVYSMGDDAALPFLERRYPIAYYLRQRFAQVTNPPIDSLREGFVFDMRAFVGSGASNGDVPAPGAIVMADHSILDEHAFDVLRFDHRLLQRAIPLGLPEGVSLERRLREICDEAENAVRDGISYLVVDNREPGAAIPAVLAVGAIHQRLTNTGLRMQVSIAAADGYARDAHSVATVIGAGANIITPWLALRAATRTGTRKAFLSAVRVGVLKIMAKLGICTLRSYIGAQTFESVGLGRDVMQMCFPGMAAHVPTLGFAELEEDLRAWEAGSHASTAVPEKGLYRFRRDGIRHAFDPLLLKTLRAAAMNGDYEAYEKLSDAMEVRPPVALRDLIEPLAAPYAISLDEVESVEAIVRRFVTAAMSLGALAPEVHAVIARAANTIGARSNSGEGGEEPWRYARIPGGPRSAIKQVASARFGVSIAYLASADEIEIKMAQGAKPGEGGQIPGFKVNAEIAALRGAVAGQALISPAPHHDIYSIEDLAELIYDLRRAAPHAKIVVKLVSQSGIGHVASGVAKARADIIHIAGHDGGTGASPLASIKYAGLPWELGLVETHHTLMANGLRSRVKLRVDGGFKSGRDVILASMLGAEEFGFGSAMLVALGCIMARQCHKNTCPVGIASQDPKFRQKFVGTAEEAVTFLAFVARDVRRRLARMGVRSLDEVFGRSDLLRPRALPEYANVDLSQVLRLPDRLAARDARLAEEMHLDEVVMLENHPGKVFPIEPSDRTVGARLAYTLVQRKLGGDDPTEFRVHYRGTAGQSFAAFITEGCELELDGDANDYVGKSMDGGRLVVRAPGQPDEAAIGNACFYGARGGMVYVSGSAGERLAVRNSGANIVVEGAGDHACEYMTAGAVAILGRVGRNLASGMTGGRAFVLGDVDSLRERLGPTECALVEMTPGDPDADVLRDLLAGHLASTGSARAKNLLDVWPASLTSFVKIAPPAVVDPAREEEIEVAAEARAAGAEPAAVSAGPRPPVSSP